MAHRRHAAPRRRHFARHRRHQCARDRGRGACRFRSLASRSRTRSSPFPQKPKPPPIRPLQIWPRISAEHPELNLADVAFTCQLGRTAFPHRRAVVVEDTRESIAALAGLDRKKIIAGPAGLAAPAFFFSGEGSQYVNMGRELHEQESVSLEALDVCAKHLREPREIGSAFRCALETLGRLWTLGVDVDWMKLHAAGSVQRVSLPTYPFERQKFWIEPDTIAKDAQPAPVPEMPSENAVSAGEAVSLYRRVWTAAPLGTISATEPSPWLLFRDAFGVADEIARYLKAAKQNFSVVEFGGSFKHLGTAATRYVPPHARITMRSSPLCSSPAELRAKSSTSGLWRRRRARLRSKRLSTGASSVLFIWLRHSQHRISKACSWRSSQITCSRWTWSLCAILLALCFWVPRASFTRSFRDSTAKPSISTLTAAKRRRVRRKSSPR